MNTTVIYIAICIISSIIVLAYLWAEFIRIKQGLIVWKFVFKKDELNIAGGELCRKLLDAANLNNIEVKKVCFLSIRSNTYSARKKTIYLNSYTYKRSHAINTPTILTLVQFAKLDAEGTANVKHVNSLGWLELANTLFLPIVILGIIFDILTNETVGGLTLLLSFATLAFFSFTFIIFVINARTIKIASDNAKEMAENLNYYDDNELNRINKMLDLQSKIYVADGIISLLYSIKIILRMLANILKVVGKK